MRGRLSRITKTLLALAVGGAGLIGVVDTAAAADLGNRQGKHVEVFDFSRVPAPAGRDGADTAATTCIGGAVWRYTSVSPTTFTAPGNTAFTTTTRCLDINMRKSTEVTWDAQACVIFVDHTASCNYWTDLSTSWKTIATNVADNSHFKVMVIFDWPNSTGTTATQLAF